MKEIKGDLNKWKSTPQPWLGTPNLVKMPTFPKVTCKFNTIPNKFPTLLPVDVQIFRHTDATLKYVLWQGKIFLNKETKLADVLPDSDLPQSRKD